MSRKTRKLIWSAPLVAVLAVAGALAMFVMLAPNGALAHEAGANTAPHQPPGPVSGIDVTTPTAEEGGRTSLRVTWNAPTTGDDATMYRVDISKDTDVWMNVIGGEASDDMWTEAEAMEDCTSDDDGNRCYTATGLDSDTLYHFRVFAMNEFGTSPISVDDTIGSGMTLRIDPPARVGGLDATDYHEDKIVVSWDQVGMTGGADVLWYCLGVAASPSGAFTDLTLADEAEECLEAEDPTPAAVADDEGVYASPVGVVITTLITAETDDPQTIVVAAKDEDGDAVAVYEHLGLHTPDVIELRYRLYAVTDEDGDPETVEDRQISRAASETATGRTVRPSDKPDPRFESPPAVGNLRAVVYNNGELVDSDLDDDTNPLTLPAPTATNQGLHFFWTHPEGFDPDYDDDETNAQVPNWYVEVQRRVAADADHDDYAGWQFVTGAAGTTELADGYATSQFTVNFSATLEEADPPTEWAAPVLWGNSKDNRHVYRVRYVNPGEDDEPDTEFVHDNTDLTDDVPGTWEEIRIPQVTTNYLRSAATGVPDADSTLPIILLSTNNTGTGLRFEYNDDDPRDHIDLLWTRDENAREGEDGPEGPHGYVIDRSADGGATWQSLAGADSPTELGTADTFTDSPGRDHDVVPGHEYTYRVFPVFIESGPDAYGVPALIDANSRGADLPTAARSVSADADGQNACVVTWRAPSDNGGHPVRGYLIQIAPDEDGEPGDWATINIVDGTRPFTVMGGAMTEFKYTGTATQVDPTGDVAEVDPLSAGSVRWFRVIPVTNENDGDQDTGGAVLAEDLTPKADRNPTDAASVGDLPLEADYTRADPDKCTTEGLGDAPADKVTADPQMPVDLTLEAASDSNSLAPSDRGVFLTWNQQPQGDASKTTSYRINRIRMNTGVAALNDEADDWQYVKRVTGVTSYTDSTDLRRDEETRMYQVCSEASGVADPVCVEMPVSYALHPEMHMPSMPQMVEATADSATEVTVSWAVPADSGGSDITGFTVRWKQSDATSYADADMAMADATASNYTVTGLDRLTSYTFQVRANNAEEMGAWSMYASAMTRAVVPSMPTDVTATAMSDTHIIVAWTVPSDNGGSAITGYEIEYTPAGGTAMTYSCTCSDGDGNLNAAGGVTLMPATEYTIRVRAINAAGMGAWSTAAMVMTKAATSADFTPPTQVMGMSGTAGELTLTWEGANTADSFVLIAVRTDTFAHTSKTIADGTARMGTFTGLASGVDYIGIVVALKGAGDALQTPHGSSAAVTIQ